MSIKARSARFTDSASGKVLATIVIQQNNIGTLPITGGVLSPDASAEVVMVKKIVMRFLGAFVKLNVITMFDIC